MGPGGSGKTYALRTLANVGITPFIIALDVQGLESVSDIPCPKLHWHRIEVKGKTWKSMVEDSKTLLMLTYEGITKRQDFNRIKQVRFISVLETLASFTCDRCGENFGEVDSWGTNRALVLDHFTELCQASKEWAVGEKLVLHEGEWQVAQNNVENLIRQLYIVPRCWTVVIAHIDREQDIITGGTKVMVHALGRKLAPKLNALFSDVVLSVRQGKEFVWDCAAVDVDLKTRNFPIESKLAPDFSTAVAKWRSRGGIVEG